MAKKKTVEPKEEEDEIIEELADDLLEDEDSEGAYPKLKKRTDISRTPLTEEDEISQYSEEELEYEAEEEIEVPSYKYLNLRLIKDVGENDYELIIEGQSHGFCNILVKHLLEIEGVQIAAYKITGIELPKIFIRLSNSKKYKIKEILHKAIESLRDEISEVYKVFKKLI